jgi:integrase/recombinase XerD
MNDSSLTRLRVKIAQFTQNQKHRGYSPKSQAQTHWALNYLLDFLTTRDEEDLTHITADTLHKFQMHLYGLLGKRGKPLGLTSQLNILVTLRVFFQWLTRQGFLLADPATGIQLPRHTQPLPRNILTLRETQKILAQPDVDKPIGLRNRALLELLYATGIRNQEVRNLTLYDVNVTEQEVHIKNGKGGKDRVLPLGEIAAKYINLYIQEARPKILRWKEDPGFLFLGRQGRRLDSSVLNDHIVRRYAREARIKKTITPHSLRHTCATHLLKNHANIRHIQALLGHKSLNSTQLYTRVEIGDLKRELRRCHPRERAP